MSTEEITAEYEVAEVAPSIELRVKPIVTVAAKTDMGRVRDNNEDKHEYFLAEGDAEIASKGHIFIVCDGMGGHEAGQVASELACKTFIDVYRNHPSNDLQLAANGAVLAANRFVNDVSRTVPGRKGMGTTLTALIIRQDKGIIAQVGDSRLYRLRDGILEMLTTDHTWIEEAVSTGMMSREEAEQHPYRHVITRALGTEAMVTPDLFELDIQVGDTFFLCSDGVTNHVKDDQLHTFMSMASPSAICWNVVSAALVDGGSDNATAMVVRVDDLENVE
ncbi:MAG: Stp1/IreP family PP2C-type Ser/Thr phosphatase [Armatimonadetes bacterium]|nr:Stp1/IreP family PP2C-type Ser/Thr phosphatase [Armatimonadota bacterium]